MNTYAKVVNHHVLLKHVSVQVILVIKRVPIPYHSNIGRGGGGSSVLTDFESAVNLNKEDDHVKGFLFENTK